MSDLEELLRLIRDTANDASEEADDTTIDDDLLVDAVVDAFETEALSSVSVEFLTRNLSDLHHVVESPRHVEARSRITSSELHPEWSIDGLRRARDTRGIPLEAAASWLGVTGNHLEAIEAGDLAGLLQLPPESVGAYLRTLAVEPGPLLRAAFLLRRRVSRLAVTDRTRELPRRARDWVRACLRAADAGGIDEVETVSDWQWTNRSVLRLAGERDPVQVILELAQSASLAARDSGWAGPPFDPIRLAELRGIELVPRDDVKDARTVPTHDGVRIEFNPTRPRPRVRYSIAHEIGHTLFPDCRAYVRNRTSYHELHDDAWQIEVLCNIAAGVFLMPIGSLPESAMDTPTIDEALTLREQFQVSVEAALIRLVRSSRRVVAVFAASIAGVPASTQRHRIDYMIGSPSWTYALAKRSLLPPDSVVGECTTIGFTAKGTEKWSELLPPLRVEAVAIAPYPGSRSPRVVGILREPRQSPESHLLTYLVGDASEPRGFGPRIIAHVVNDATANWGGGGFAQFLRRKWPQVQIDFKDWARSSKALRLGRVHFSSVETDLWVAHMVAQHGYGPSTQPRIRYQALQTCLTQVCDLALATGATVHMPRIGAGQAGGDWTIIQDLIKTEVCGRQVPVTVYDPSGTSATLRLPQI